MPISDKTRKILWAKSGNRCAICRVELIMDSSYSGKSIVGDECHIISKEKLGPRNDPSQTGDLDDYYNLILLCKVHHKLIDDLPNDFPVDKLKDIKRIHETWVDEVLKNGAIKLNELKNEVKVDEFLPRVFSGKELVAIVRGTHFFDFSNCEIENHDEMELISSFGEILEDYGDLLDELGIGKRVEIEYELSIQLKDLESAGFYVFGARVQKRMKMYGVLENWVIAVVRVLRKEDPSIIHIDLNGN